MTTSSCLRSFALTLQLGALTPALSAAQAAAGAAPPMSAVETAARVPLEAYLRGHATGDSTVMRRAFWREAKLWFVRDGQLASRAADEYVGSFTGAPARDEAQRRRRIVSVQVMGDAAVAVIELDYPAVRFTDYMTLLKVGEEWRIINKSFHAARHSTPVPASMPDLSGIWDFTVDVGTRLTQGELVLRWHDDRWTGTLTPAGTNTLAIASLAVTTTGVRLEVTTPEGPVVFVGSLDDSAREMRGTVTYHHGERYPLTARRK